MRTLLRIGLVLGILALTPTWAFAGCGIEKGDIRILSNDFPALRTITSLALECDGDGVTVSVNHTAEHENLQVAALTPNPSEYTSKIVANGSLVPLVNKGLVRPLNDLVAKYGDGLQNSQLITVDGQVMAVAFMANTQHLFYREDILKAAGLEVPTTVEEVLAAAEVIRSKGLIQNPFAAAYKAGWNLGEEFVNMYLGHGGEFFKPGTAESTINNEIGVATLTKMKALASYSTPDFLTLESEGIKAEWEAGNVALMFLWASRASTLLDDEGSTPQIVSSTKLTGPPTVAGGSIPISTLWWDGFTIATNIPDEDAEATFKALVRPSTSSEMANKNADQAVWLIDGFTPGPRSIGVISAAKAGAKPYPMLPYMGLLHNAAGAEIVEFLQGRESAEQALADVEAAYATAAKEAGFLQ